jgi:hypothetical protein
VASGIVPLASRVLSVKLNTKEGQGIRGMQYTRTRVLVLAGVIAVAASAWASASFDRSTDASVLAGYLKHRDLVAETHLYCMALAVYFEGGSTAESEVGQRHIARVVHERAKANLKKWGGSDICDVVFYMRKRVCQFSFACLPLARRTPKDGPAWRYSMAIARDELQGRSAVQERSIRYYMNPALTPARNACRFRKEFVRVTVAGRHEFFREPSRTEQAQLAKTQPTECTRHAQMLAAKKRVAKLKAAKHKNKRLAVLAKKKGKKVKLARR